MILTQIIRNECKNKGLRVIGQIKIDYNDNPKACDLFIDCFVNIYGQSEQLYLQLTKDFYERGLTFSITQEIKKQIQEYKEYYYKEIDFFKNKNAKEV